MINQPITSGRLSGTSINMYLIDREGNETSPLFSIDDQRRHRMVIDYEMNKVMFTDRPEEWHTLPTTKKGLMMIPLTKEACDKHKIEPPPAPHPEAKKVRNTKKGEEVHGSFVHGAAFLKGWQGDACV